MRQLALAGLAAVFVSAVWIWGFGGDEVLARWAANGQRDIQNQMAHYLRALKRGDAAALVSLMGLCFAYGFFHAIGPGHGKLIIGGYGAASQVSTTKLSALAIASSLAQSVTAIVLVGLGVLIFGWTRAQMTGFADDVLSSVSAGAVALVGIWLAIRGVRAIRTQLQLTHRFHVKRNGDFDSDVLDTSSAAGCGDPFCTHHHGPTAQEAEAVRTWRDGVAIVAAVAIRPCTGALFLLIITSSMGIFFAGILGTLVMGLGTASVTVLVAIAATRMRVAALSELHILPWASGTLQLAGGLLIALVAGQIALASL